MIPHGPYSYIPGPNTLGIGIDNLALQRPGIPIDEPIYGERYNVRMSLSPLCGAMQYPLAPSGPSNSLRQNGVYISGDMALQALADFEKEMNRK